MPLYVNGIPQITPLVAFLTHVSLSFICMAISIMELVLLFRIGIQEDETLFKSYSYRIVQLTQLASFLVPPIHMTVFVLCMCGFISLRYNFYLTSCFLLVGCLFWHLVFFCVRVMNVVVYFFILNCRYEGRQLSNLCYNFDQLNSLGFLECIFYITMMLLLVYLICHLYGLIRSCSRPSYRINRSPPSYNAIQ